MPHWLQFLYYIGDLRSITKICFPNPSFHLTQKTELLIYISLDKQWLNLQGKDVSGTWKNLRGELNLRLNKIQSPHFSQVLPFPVTINNCNFESVKKKYVDNLQERRKGLQGHFKSLCCSVVMQLHRKPWALGHLATISLSPWNREQIVPTIDICLRSPITWCIMNP